MKINIIKYMGFGESSLSFDIYWEAIINDIALVSNIGRYKNITKNIILNDIKNKNYTIYHLSDMDYPNLKKIIREFHIPDVDIIKINNNLNKFL